MARDGADLESRIEQLDARLLRVEQRLARLDGPSPFEEPANTDQPSGAVAVERERDAPVSETIPLIGRTLLILGGAFLLRAVTEREVLGAGAGAVLGIVYSMVWLVLADRAAHAGRRTSAAFFGFSTAIIAFPLVWEVTVKFALLGPAGAAGVLAVIVVPAVAVASRRTLASLAWVMVAGSIATASVLSLATKSLVPSAWFLLLVGMLTLWIETRHGWRALAVIGAVGVNAVAVLMVLITLLARRPGIEDRFRPADVLVLLLSLVVLYLGTLVGRSLMLRRDLTAGEMFLGALAFIVGMSGVTLVSRGTGEWVVLVGIAGLVLGAACYAASFAFIDRSTGHRGSFIFYSTVALILALIAFEFLLRGPLLAVGLCIAAVLTALLGVRKARATLSLHGAVYSVTAAVYSGAMVEALRSATAPGVPATTWITPVVGVVVLTAALFCWLPVATHGRTWGKFARVPKLAVLVVLVTTLGGIVIALGASLLARVGASGADPARVAVLRTGVVSLAATVLAFAGRWKRIPEAAWLVYPLLLAGGIKLAFEDFRVGRPASLVVSLALFGGALIIAPRLLRGSRGGSSPDRV